VQAEKLVLAANSDKLATCALRPSGIFGPGNDRLLVPSVAKRGQTGKIKYIIGSGDNIFDWTYVGNVAAAHLCAAAHLDIGGAASGQAFFITNDEPTGFWEMLGDISEGLGYARPSVKLPVWLMMVLAYLALLFGALFGVESDLNPMRVRIASVQRTMSCAKAKTLLGYAPLTSMQRGKELTIAGFQHLHKRGVGKVKGA
jgi:plant 3beta-hydroxysteroid-4alpha-carboxylate 3-dehydrogenase